MCLSRLSLLSVPYIICLCHLDLADSRLLMIPSDRHLNHNELVTNEAIKKVMLPTTISNKSICILTSLIFINWLTVHLYLQSLPYSVAKNDEDQFQAISSANKICSIKLPYDDQLQKTRYDKTKKKIVLEFEIKSKEGCTLKLYLIH